MTVGKRDDFTNRFIEHGTSDGTPMATIDWDAAITALHAGELPCSAGERRVLAATASIAAGIPVDLRDTATGLDARNIQPLNTAISPPPGNANNDSPASAYVRRHTIGPSSCAYFHIRALGVALALSPREC